MALGAILAAALTDHSSRFIAIYVDGFDVSYDPLGPTINYAVPLDSILIEEAGPAGVSSMEFRIECPTAMFLTIAEGAEVRFEHLALSPTYTFFRGWVDHVDIENMDGSVGTRFMVRCTGIEALLDWAVILSDTTIAAGTAIEAAVQACAAAAYCNGIGALRAIAGTGGFSSQAGPIQAPWSGTGLDNALTVTAGTTLREAVRSVGAQAYPGIAVNPLVTVDFWGGLRYFSGINEIADQSTLTIDDDPPLTGDVAEDLQYGYDAGQYRAVIVRGTGVSVTVTDGTGRAGPTAVLDDSTITTVAAATAAGQSYLAQYATEVRGQWSFSDYGAAARLWHAFNMAVTITDARVGLSGYVPRVTAMARSNFTGVGREDVTFSFGGNPPSVTALTRQLTRTTLS